MGPFEIAVTRGHYELAAAILEIAALQYAPKQEEPVRKKFEVVVDTKVESDYSDSEADSGEEDEDDDHGVTVRFDIINEQHTIDDIRETANAVKSSVSPSDLLSAYHNVGSLLDLGYSKTKVELSFDQCCTSNLLYYGSTQSTGVVCSFHPYPFQLGYHPASTVNKVLLIRKRDS